MRLEIISIRERFIGLLAHIANLCDDKKEEADI